MFTARGLRTRCGAMTSLNGCKWNWELKFD